MRVLLDSNILVRATGKASSPARAVFLRLMDPPHAIVASTYLLDELRRVLQYPRVQRIHGLSREEADQFVREVEMIAEVVNVPAPTFFHVQHDPDDDPIVAASVYGRVNVLCTLDRHLHRPEVMAYFASFNIRVLSDVDLLAGLRAQNSGSP
jgi:uncharacterized protein